VPELIDIVTHFFPPVGGPASNRLVGWAKHFAASGRAVRVTTPVPHVADPYFGDGEPAPPEVVVNRVPGIDLARHVRGSRAAAGGDRRRRLLEAVRDLLDLPDHRRVWNAAAVRSLRRLQPAPRVLITTSPYASTHLIGLRLKRRPPGLFWVADIRDPWMQQWDRRRHTALHRAYAAALERKVARYADLLVFFHRTGVENMASRVGEAVLADKTLVVYNGFSDEAADVFAAHPFDLAADPVRLTFAGTIWEWNLPPGFLDGWQGFRSALPRASELHLHGRIEPGPLARIRAARAAEPAALTVHGCQPHAAATAAMARSSALLVFSGPYRESVSSKLFECIAARRPILYFGLPDSAGAGILRDVGAPAAVIGSYDDRGVAGLFDRFARALISGDCSGFVPARVPPELRSAAQAGALLARITRSVS
jgi:hypothetical protein